MKKYLVISFLALAFSAMTASATTSSDFIAISDINVGGGMIIRNESRAESWSYSDAGVFTVTNPASSYGFSVASTVGLSIRVTSGGAEVACTDNSTPGTSYVTVPLTSGDSTITTSSSACSSTSVVSRASGRSSGGGGTPPPRPATTTPATPAVPGVSPAIPASPALANASPYAAFNRRLIAGSTGDDVRSLQRFLNARGFVVAAIGGGSPGNETTFFGPATKRALIKFQLANGVIQNEADPGAGTFGPKSRAKVNELNTAANAGASVGTPVAPTTFSPNQLSQLLQLIRQLQAH